MASKQPIVEIGTKFHAVLADGNCEFEVKAKSGRGVWLCIVTPENIDYSGTVKHFSTVEIQQALNFQKAFDDARNGKQAFYDSLSLGQIIHYHNGFGQFIRCEVVMGVTVHSKGKQVKCAKPLAMVGKWNAMDLPRRNRDGSIHLGHHAESIAKGECFAPHHGCIWESSSYSEGRKHHGDPTKMEPLSLEVPPMDAAAERRAGLEQVRQSVRSILDEFQDDPAKAILAAKEMLATVSL